MSSSRVGPLGSTGVGPDWTTFGVVSATCGPEFEQHCSISVGVCSDSVKCGSALVKVDWIQLDFGRKHLAPELARNPMLEVLCRSCRHRLVSAPQQEERHVVQLRFAPRADFLQSVLGAPPPDTPRTPLRAPRPTAPHTPGASKPDRPRPPQDRTEGEVPEHRVQVLRRHHQALPHPGRCLTSHRLPLPEACGASHQVQLQNAHTKTRGECRVFAHGLCCVALAMLVPFPGEVEAWFVHASW